MSTHCTKLTSILALTPYAAPTPREHESINLDKKETNKTLFLSDPNNEKQYKIRKNYFDSLNIYIFSMYNLQTEYIFPPEDHNLHQDSLPLFLHHILNPSIPIYKLTPVPSLISIDFPTLFYNYLFSLHVCPHRATWVIHNYLYQTGMSRENLTEFLKSFTKMSQKDHDYYIKLIYSLYSENLLNHMKIIEWLIQNFQPELIEIFKNEIFNSFKLLSLSLNSNHCINYIKMMNDLLINRPSQIVQLAISTTYQSPEFSSRFLNDIFQYMNIPTKKRTNAIIKAIKINYVSLSIKTYLMLSLNFPYYDIPVIINEFRVLFQYISNKEKEQYTLEIISFIRDFPNEQETIAAVIIELIKLLDIQFPLNEFINFLYENIQSIEIYAFFFFELQFQKFFDYKDFLRIISITGKSAGQYESTFKIIENLPPLEFTKKIRGKVRQILIKNSKVLYEYERLFKECCSNIEKNLELTNKLPPYYVYMIGYLVLNDKKIDFFKKTQILSQLNLEPMIFSIFEGEEKPSFSLFSLLQIKHFIPLLYSRGNLDKFFDIVTNESDAVKYFDICFFLNESFSFSSYLKNYKDKIQIICNKKIEFINTEIIGDLAYNYSYLFNVVLLNDFFCVKNMNDFQKLFFVFLKNLLSFESLCVEQLWNFFVSFTESYCISFPLQFFINIFLLVSLFGIKMNDRIKSIIFMFFSILIKKRFYTGNEYLNSIYKIVVSRRIDINDCENANHLFDILSAIVEKYPNLFTFSNLIQNSVANWLTIRNRHLRDIIRPLSSNSIIITQSMINMLHAPPSNYGAVFFYLLPNELFDSDTDQVFNFYSNNVSYNTMLLWTIWLKNRPLYKIEKISDEIFIGNQKTEKTELIVLPNYLLNEYTENYRIQISNYFLKITSNSEEKDPQMMDIYLESFKLLCDHQKIAKITFDLLINELNRYSVRFSMDSIRLTFYLFSYLNEKQVEVLCNALLKFDLDLIFEDDSFIFKCGYFILICFAKFARQANSKILMQTANKILQLIAEISEINESQFQSTQFLIDCFNFYVAITSSKDIQFHDEFMEIIKDNLSKIKGKLKKALILNQTPRIFDENHDPLFISSLDNSSSHSSEILSTSNQINDIFAVDVGDDWF